MAKADFEFHIPIAFIKCGARCLFEYRDFLARPAITTPDIDTSQVSTWTDRLAQAAVLDDPIEDYETAFRVVPDGKASDTWLLCPGSDAASADWIATIMPSA